MLWVKHLVEVDANKIDNLIYKRERHGAGVRVYQVGFPLTFHIIP